MLSIIIIFSFCLGAAFGASAVILIAALYAKKLDKSRDEDGKDCANCEDYEDYSDYADMDIPDESQEDSRQTMRIVMNNDSLDFLDTDGNIIMRITADGGYIKHPQSKHEEVMP